MTDLASDIETNAQGPRQVTSDAGSVQQHSLPDLIAADEYLRNKTARNKSTLPIRLAKLRPDGTT